jgi:hypothetical protein
MDSRDFCYDSAEPAMPQAFLETDEDRRLIARLDIDHAIGHEPGLREGRGEQILPGETPEQLAPQMPLVLCQSISRSKSTTFSPRPMVSHFTPADRHNFPGHVDEIL